MTLYAPSGGKRLRFKATVLTSDPVSMITVSDRAFVYTVESLSVRLKGTDTTFDFSVDDGLSNISFAGQQSINDEKYWHQSDHHVTVEYGEALKFTAGGATIMDVTVIALETDTSEPLRMGKPT